MTMLEERYMNAVPTQLRGLADAIKGLYAVQQMPIIEFTSKDELVFTEQFKGLRHDIGDRVIRYFINEREVTSEEYNRISHLIYKHPLFLN